MLAAVAPQYTCGRLSVRSRMAVTGKVAMNPLTCSRATMSQPVVAIVSHAGGWVGWVGWGGRGGGDAAHGEGDVEGGDEGGSGLDAEERLVRVLHCLQVEVALQLVERLEGHLRAGGGT